LVRIKSSTTLGAGITISFEPSDDLLALVAALRTGNLDSFFLEHGETIYRTQRERFLSIHSALMIIAAGVVVVGIGEPEHLNDGVFGFDERSDFAKFHERLPRAA